MQAIREGLLAKMVLYSLEIYEFARQHASQDKSIKIIVAQLSKVTYCFLIGLVACSRKRESMPSAANLVQNQPLIGPF